MFKELRGRVVEVTSWPVPAEGAAPRSESPRASVKLAASGDSRAPNALGVAPTRLPPGRLWFYPCPCRVYPLAPFSVTAVPQPSGPGSLGLTVVFCPFWVYSMLGTGRVIPDGAVPGTCTLPPEPAAGLSWGLLAGTEATGAGAGVLAGRTPSLVC